MNSLNVCTISPKLTYAKLFLTDVKNTEKIQELHASMDHDIIAVNNTSTATENKIFSVIKRTRKKIHNVVILVWQLSLRRYLKISIFCPMS